MDARGCGWGSATSRRHRQLRLLLAAQAVAFVFFAIVIPIEVVFAKRTLDAGVTPAMAPCWRAGAPAWSSAGSPSRSFGAPPFASCWRSAPWRSAVAYLATGAAPTLLVACAASAVGGAGNGVQWVALMTAVQQLTRADYQARVISLLESLAAAMPGLGFVIGGAVAAHLRPARRASRSPAPECLSCSPSPSWRSPGRAGAPSLLMTPVKPLRPCFPGRRRPERQAGKSSRRLTRRPADPATVLLRPRKAGLARRAPRYRERTPGY